MIMKRLILSSYKVRDEIYYFSKEYLESAIIIWQKTRTPIVIPITQEIKAIKNENIV